MGYLPIKGIFMIFVNKAFVGRRIAAIYSIICFIGGTALIFIKINPLPSNYNILCGLGSIAVGFALFVYAIEQGPVVFILESDARIVYFNVRLFRSTAKVLNSNTRLRIEAFAKRGAYQRVYLDDEGTSLCLGVYSEVDPTYSAITKYFSKRDIK
jgi:hypothetical protein